jgi:two-component system, OmpR family, alkaline phosphatase synthesis response regulator PhoP
MVKVKCRILIVDDNETVRRIVSTHFTELGYDVAEARDGVSGLEAALSERANVIILDVEMPGMDGFRVCQFVRERGVITPVIMLTDRSKLEDRVAGFEHGADDYLAKPFSPVELEMRVKALLRRAKQCGHEERLPEHKPLKPKALQRGPLKIDLERHAVNLNGAPVDLTPIEFNILKLLAYTPGKVYSRAELLDLIWDTSYDGYKRNIDPHITRLRTKIEDDPRNPRYIQTVWGVGYKFNEQTTTVN